MTFHPTRILLATILVASGAIGTTAQAGSIKVSNLSVTSPGSNAVVKGDVAVTGLADGEYDVTVVVINQTAGGIDKTTKAKVTITNGKGSLNVIGTFPMTSPGDAGSVQVEVSDPNSGVSDVEEGDWSIPGAP